ncbi:MAG: hypothetical protein CL678_09825 [Bdellovibrionaceae bacterium]|nr:hypothetical protein [Pseudobdellovibrionaceae bacterium]|tara:strand:+ start:4278 stop:4889 length:612 start_codon:yes stop_codon:yes gene_type:complete
MAVSKDLSPEEKTWIHDLARAEVHPDAERLLGLGNSYHPERLIEESTVGFLEETRHLMEEFARVFNGYSSQGQKFSSVKIYSISQTAADFMLFRNQIKLNFIHSSHGVIQISFSKHQSNSTMLATNESRNQLLGDAHEIVARMGAFRNVDWFFENEKITPLQIAKFYFSEFVRSTRVGNEESSSNKVLLDQIKTLLEEKGLSL